MRLAPRKRQTGMQIVNADITTDLYVKFVADRRSCVLRSRNPRQVVHRHRTRIIALYAHLRRSRRLSRSWFNIFPLLSWTRSRRILGEVIKCLHVTVSRRAMHFISHRYDNHLQCGETCMLKSGEVGCATNAISIIRQRVNAVSVKVAIEIES